MKTKRWYIKYHNIDLDTQITRVVDTEEEFNEIIKDLTDSPNRIIYDIGTVVSEEKEMKEIKPNKFKLFFNDVKEMITNWLYKDNNDILVAVIIAMFIMFFIGCMVGNMMR